AARARTAQGRAAERRLRLGVARHDRDHAAAPATRELHGAGGLCVDRVVLAEADAVAGLEPGAALAHDDLATGDHLAGEHLHAEPLGVRVAPVARGTKSLLMS